MVEHSPKILASEEKAPPPPPRHEVFSSSKPVLLQSVTETGSPFAHYCFAQSVVNGQDPFPEFWYVSPKVKFGFAVGDLIFRAK